jgi:outer membrane protein
MSAKLIALRSRQLTAVALAYTLAAAPVFAADESNIRVDRPQAPVFLRPYQGTYVPPINVNNSNRFSQLIRGGNLYLTVQDTIALALENNIDLELQRYLPLASLWALQRSEAGGALRGVNTVSNSNFGVTAGQGVQGASSIVGNGTGLNVSTGQGPSGNAVVAQIGPVTQNLDPAYQGLVAFAHTTQPQPNPFLSGVEALVDNRKLYQNSITQGIISGGQATLSFNESYLNENALTNVINPTVSPVLGLTFSHNLLNGFGIAVGARAINVAKQNLTVSDLNFESQVVSVVSNVLTLYWGLVSDIQDVQAKQSSVDLARRLYNDNKKQVELGTMAPLDITQAESQLAASERDLIFSKTAAQQQEVRLKNVISRKGIGDPVIANIHIVPLDHIEVPETLQTSQMESLLERALKERYDISAERINLENTKTATLGTRNGILPNLRVFTTLSSQGLAGHQNPNAFPELGNPDPAYLGDFGHALEQIFRLHYLTERIGISYSEPIHNYTAQGDYGIEQLQLRQTEIRTQKDLNQVAVDISNQLIALKQAHTRYKAATQSRVLEEQLVTAEQKKYQLGSSTTFAVIQVQRDLATAKANEIAAQAQYANAKIGLERVLGTTLQDYNISVDEAKNGKVARNSVIPPNPPPF